MKILFLDLDGVLIKFGDTPEIRKSRSQKGKGGIIYDFDLDLVENLKHIIEETGAKIVISSSWRHNYEKLKEAFDSSILDWGYVDGYTPSNLGYGRGNEILTRLDFYHKVSKYPITHWVSIDDSDADQKVIKRLGNFVHCNSYEGLTIEKMREAINILNDNSLNIGN